MDKISYNVKNRLKTSESIIERLFHVNNNQNLKIKKKKKYFVCDKALFKIVHIGSVLFCQILALPKHSIGMALTVASTWIGLVLMWMLAPMLCAVALSIWRLWLLNSCAILRLSAGKKLPSCAGVNKPIKSANSLLK